MRKSMIMGTTLILSFSFYPIAHATETAAPQFLAVQEGQKSAEIWVEISFENTSPNFITMEADNNPTLHAADYKIHITDEFGFSPNLTELGKSTFDFEGFDSKKEIDLESGQSFTDHIPLGSLFDLKSGHTYKTSFSREAHVFEPPNVSVNPKNGTTIEIQSNLLAISVK
jgi:hypothetical protein